MSFANEFKRAVKGIAEEISHYREFDQLDGMAQPIAALEELQDKWEERTVRFAGRGKLPTEPFDWADDKIARSELKESMNRIIKAAAAAAAEAAAAAADELLDDGEAPDATSTEAEVPPLEPRAGASP